MSLREKEAALVEAEAQLQKLRQELQRLQTMYDAKMKEKSDLIEMVFNIFLFQFLFLSLLYCNINLFFLVNYITGRIIKIEIGKSCNAIRWTI